jgi:putative exosortase-associated protein (TIGR04073 family)
MKKTLLTMMAVMLVTITGVYAQPEGPSSTMTVNTYSAGFLRTQPEEAMLAASAPKAWTIEKSYYTDSPVSKGSDGFINATTSWADIPAEVAETTEDQNLLAGVTVGFGKGLASSVVRGAAGVVDMATFMFPPYDEPLAEPEYAVEQPQEGYKVNIFRW